MSNRMECPGCNAETSTVLFRFENGESCPYCGLSATAALEIIAVKTTTATAHVKKLHIEAVKSRDEWQRRAKKAESIIRIIKWEVDNAETDTTND